MTEDEAQEWLRANFDVSRETWERLETFIAYLKREAASQNLIAASTLESIWSRHIVDSAQLLKLLPDAAPSNGKWIDLGSGAGFPGIVVAILSDHPVTLVESRGRRIDYLQRAIELLDLDNLTLAGMPLERLEAAPYSVISARAFAPLPRLFELAARFSTDKTNWLLPKGRNAVKEWEEVQAVWAGNFRIEPSVTDADSGILVGQLSAKRQKPR
jgi:16S rRNA (guanine527-N7)-methyltransferase